MIKSALLLCSLCLSLASCEKREDSSSLPLSSLKIVGSETVFPYAATIAEEFSHAYHTPAPVLESVGTGAGVQLFCRGPGVHTPSVLMASRPLSHKDYALCQAQGVPREDIEEIPIGREGLVLVQSLSAKPLNLTTLELFRTLSVSHTPLPHTWRDVSPEFPDVVIKILGPAHVSGSYESLVDLALKPFCTSSCSSRLNIRHDGAYMEMGSNQNVLIERVVQNPLLVGIISFGFFKRHAYRLRGIPLNGIFPSFENCCSNVYPFVRPLYLYAKKSHFKSFPLLKKYVERFFVPEAVGEKGTLVEKGFIPLAPPCVKPQESCMP